MGKYFGTDGFRGEAGITLTADHAAIIASFGNIPAIRYLLQHSRWSARRFSVLRGDEGKKASVKLDEIVI